MSSGRLRRLNRSISRNPQTNEEESDNNNNKSRGQALKLLRKKSYLNRNKKLDSPTNSESAANWRARLRSARGFRTEENANTESSNVRKVLLRINTGKYLNKDKLKGDDNDNKNNKTSKDGNSNNNNNNKTSKDGDEKDNNDDVKEDKNQVEEIRHRVSIFDKAKEKLKQNPHIAKTSTGKLLLRPSTVIEQSPSLRLNSIKKLGDKDNIRPRKRVLSQADYNRVRRASTVIASQLGLPPPPSAAPPSNLPNLVIEETPPPPPSSLPPKHMELINEVKVVVTSKPPIESPPKVPGPPPTPPPELQIEEKKDVFAEDKNRSKKIDIIEPSMTSPSNKKITTIANNNNNNDKNQKMLIKELQKSQPPTPALPASTPPSSKNILKKINNSNKKTKSAVKEVKGDSPHQKRRSEKLRRLSNIRKKNEGSLPLKPQVIEESSEKKDNEEKKTNGNFRREILSTSPLSILNSTDLNTFDMFDLLPATIKHPLPLSPSLSSSATGDNLGLATISAIRRSTTASTRTSSSPINRSSGFINNTSISSPLPPPPSPPPPPPPSPPPSASDNRRMSNNLNINTNMINQQQRQYRNPTSRRDSFRSPTSPYLERAMQLSPGLDEKIRLRKERYFTPNGVNLRKERVSSSTPSMSNSFGNATNVSPQLSPHRTVSTRPFRSREDLAADQQNDLRRLELLRSTWAHNHSERMAELDEISVVLDDNRNDVNSISSSNQQLLMHPKQRRDYRMLPGGIDSKILPEGIISVHAVKAAAKQHFHNKRLHDGSWNQHVPDEDHLDVKAQILEQKQMNYHHQSYYEEHGNNDNNYINIQRPVIQMETKQTRKHGVNRRHGDGTQLMKSGRRYEEFGTNNINLQLEVAKKRAVKMMQQRKKHYINNRSKRHSSIGLGYFKGNGTFGTGINGVPNYFTQQYDSK